MFLAKTWPVEARLTSVCDSLQFDHYHGVSKINHGGGLTLFWKNDFDIQVISSSFNHIDVVVCRGTDKAWRFIG